MAERRSMGNALNISPDKLAFIQGGAPATNPEPAAPPAVEAKPVRETGDLSQSVPVNTADDLPESGRSTRRTRSRRSTRTLPTAPEADALFPGLANLLVPLTTRLHPVTANALRRAGLEQRLRGQQPATVQEIAEEALQDWLKDHGFPGVGDRDTLSPSQLGMPLPARLSSGRMDALPPRLPDPPLHIRSEDQSPSVRATR